MKYFKTLIILLLPLVLLGIITSNATAQEDINETGLVLRPAILDLPAEPGTTISATITLQNISNSAVSVDIGSQSLIPNDPEIDQEKRKDYDASTWIVTSNDQLLLDEDEIRNVDVQFLVPEDAGPGGHYALITFATNSVSQQTGSGSIVTPSLTSLALITVAGDIRESAQSNNFSMPLFVIGNDQTASFEISNTGNVHILPSAVMRIYDRDGQLVETQMIDAQLILPNTTKSFVVDWSTNDRVGIYRTVIDVNYGTPLQTISMEGGVIVMLPGFTALLIWFALFIGIIVMLVIALSKLHKKWTARFGRRHYRISKKPKKASMPDNRPSDMAGLSMGSDHIDELMSSNNKPRPSPQPSQSAPKPVKRRKIDI